MNTPRLLKAEEVEARIQSVNDRGAIFLLYKDARVDQKILDETFGPMNWQRSHQLIDGKLFCTVSVWDDDRKQWVSKQDVGTESNTEKEKGQASDAFKRACFNWGIGRELYSAPFIFVGSANKYSSVDVVYIGYDENTHNINGLVLVDSKTRNVMYRWGNIPQQEQPQQSQVQTQVPTPTPVVAPQPSEPKVQKVAVKSQSSRTKKGTGIPTPTNEQTDKKTISAADTDRVKRAAQYCLTNNISPNDAVKGMYCVGDVVTAIQIAMDEIKMEQELTNK